MPPTVDSETQFTIAVINDTQNYVHLDNGIFEAMAQWVADNRDTFNIQTFFHGGDIVEDYNDEPAEWDRAESAISTITDAGIAPVLATGNHDTGTSSTRDRTLTEFRSRFGLTWYGDQLDNDQTVLGWGTYENEPENIYIRQEINGVEYLWFGVEYLPRDGVLEWVVNTAQNYPDAIGAYLSHAYLDYSGSFGTDTRYINVSDANTGIAQWRNCVSQTDNIEFGIGGHYHSGTQFNARRTDEAASGGQIVSQHHNYQSASSNGGDGWLRLLVVDTETDSVEAYTYSPYLDEWDDGNSTRYSFTLKDLIVNRDVTLRQHNGKTAVVRLPNGDVAEVKLVEQS